MSEISQQQGDFETRFRSFADVMPAMIRMAGTDRRCDYVNKGWLRFTGRRLEDEIGHGWFENVHPDDLEQCRSRFLEAFESHQTFRMRYRLRRHDGAYRWIVDDGTPRFTRGGLFAGYVGAGLDIHEERGTEGRLRHLLAERDRLLAIVDAPLQEVRLRIGNTLQLIGSFLVLQASRSANPEAAEEIRSCLVRIHAIGLVLDLLYGAKSAAIRLDDFLDHLCSRLLEALDCETRIAVKMDIEPAVLDEDTMIQVALIVSEAIAVAAKHAFPDGRRGTVSLSFRRRGNRGLLTIVDNGIGYLATSETAGAYGLELIRILAGRISGTVRHLRSAEGSRFQLEFALVHDGGQ